MFGFGLMSGVRRRRIVSVWERLYSMEIAPAACGAALLLQATTSDNGHGDVVALTDANGTTVATYSYETFGTPTIWEAFTTGWHNPF